MGFSSNSEKSCTFLLEVFELLRKQQFCKGILNRERVHIQEKLLQREM